MNAKNELKIKFLGAAGTVTGSKYLLSAFGKNILIDCGLFQGLKELRQLNRSNLPCDVSAIDCVVLTHGHLDHVGYLPLLVKQGFEGTIYGSKPTIDIAKIILLDSARIHEEDAERANTFHFSKHSPALPLYNTEDAQAVFPLFSEKPVHEWIELVQGISFRLRPNGHILGAVFIEMNVGTKRIVFSGDIGRAEDPLLYSPEQPETADILLMESTYGDRLHPENPAQQLADAINRALNENGTIIVPGFAVERTQLLMFYMWQLRKEGKIPAIPIYLDSPMGTNVLALFEHHTKWHKLSDQEFKAMCQFVHVVETPAETLKLAHKSSAKVIIAGSGMASGGRVLSYFEKYLNDPRATILFVGYQGEGTRGRALLNGEKEIKMRGKYWPVSAKIALVEGLSAHADQWELIAWLNKLRYKPEHIFVVHGEKHASETLKLKLNAMAHNCTIPVLNQEFSWLV